MINDKAEEVVVKLFESLLRRYQIGLETSMRTTDFISDCVNFLDYKCHNINLKHGESYIYSSDWIKNKKSIINPINDVDKCFQYAARSH